MTANVFFEHFATLADAQGGIPKLRELILQSAIQGKLLPQDANDETIQPYLDEIRAKRSALVKAGKAKRLEDDPLPSNGQSPFQIPESWAWIRLGEVTQKLGAGSTPLGGKAVYLSEGIKFLRSQNVWNHGLDLDDVAFISSAIHQEMSGTVVEPGDILLNITGASIGRCALVPDDFDEANVSQHVSIVRLIDKSTREFVHACIVSTYFQDTIMRVQVGVSREGLSMARLQHILIPLPPLAEQKRIVAKVDRLMALCDALEARQQARHAVRSRLHATLMGNLQTAANAADFARAWQRLRDHFAELFAPGEAALDAVAQLRQTILRLAVQGKLVPRDADDEPVSKLLRQIHEERARLVESGELRDAPPLDQIADKELLFSIPSSWQWVRAGDICQGITSGTTPPQAVFQDSPDSAIPYLKVYNIRNQRVDFEYKPQYIAETYHRSKMKRSTLFPGDVIMNIVGPPLGKVAIIPDSFPEWNCNQAIVFFRLLGQVVPSYLHAYLMEGSYLRNIELIGTAGQDNISVTKSKNIVIPLPPLAEQQRIVAKVQQLMAQCDALEASLKEAATVSERWSAAVVRRFSAIAR